MLHLHCKTGCVRLCNKDVTHSVLLYKVNIEVTEFSSEAKEKKSHIVDMAVVGLITDNYEKSLFRMSFLDFYKKP